MYASLHKIGYAEILTAWGIVDSYASNLYFAASDFEAIFGDQLHSKIGTISRDPENRYDGAILDLYFHR